MRKKNHNRLVYMMCVSVYVCSTTKEKKRFYLFNDTKIYCIPLFIATQTIPSDILSWCVHILSIFVVKHCTICNFSLLLLLSCHKSDQCATVAHTVPSLYFFRCHSHTFNGHGPCNSSSFVISHVMGEKCALM